MKSTLTSERPPAAAGRGAGPGPAGAAAPLGATVTPAASISASSRSTRPRVELLFFDREDDAPAVARHPIDPATNRTYHYWHVFVPGIAAGPDLRLSRVTGPFDPAKRPAVRSRARCCSIRTAARVVVPDGLRPRRPRPAGRQRRDGDEERGRRSRPRTTGKATRRCGRPSARTIIYEMHVRGFTRHPSSGRRRRDARHLRRADREDSVSAAIWASPPSSCCRCSSSTRRTAPPGTRQLLGLSAGLVLRAARGLQLAPGPARARSTSSATW